MRRALLDAETALSRIVGGVIADECEGPTLDFKEDRGSSADTEKLVAAAAICFANSNGGAIVLGVNDKTKGVQAFTGKNISIDRIKQRVYELSIPHLVVDVHIPVLYPSLRIILVPQSPDIHSDTQGRATQRINKDCVTLDPMQLTRLREERRGIDWSSEPSGRYVSEISADVIALTKSTLLKFNDNRRALGTLSINDIISAMDGFSSGVELNRAAALMFCADHERLHPALVYQYRPTQGGEPTAVQRLGTPLISAFQRTMELVAARQSLTPLTLPNGQQITIEDFPSLAVREALSNGICHRDYHLSNSVIVEHSPVAFVVSSPGPLVSGVTPDNIITTSSRPRNATLSNIARILGLAEELGRGVDRMYREMIRSGRQVPRIDTNFDSVRVVLVGGGPDTNIAKFVAVLPEHEQSDTDTMLIIFRLCASRTISASTIAGWLQKSTEEAEMVLRRLAGDGVGILETTRATIGRSRAIFRLRSEALKGLGSAVVYQRRTTDEIDKKITLHVQEYGRITNRTIQNMLDVGVFKSRDIIKYLVKRNILIRTSTHERGPKVEWGPGPEFPRAKGRKRG
ncbi:ATP-binding protein [Methylobacterium sp. Leaf361]|uniref:ATP-binding protein n=1 Tax=Methylobacterium sp. Leaf361 TaxID=1736352 RepID=UPI000B285F9F|nr:ATP-binding protein [Methylobacterium sp. Leaf361]